MPGRSWAEFRALGPLTGHITGLREFLLQEVHRPAGTAPKSRKDRQERRRKDVSRGRLWGYPAHLEETVKAS